MCYLTQTTPKFQEYSDRDSDEQTKQQELFHAVLLPNSNLPASDVLAAAAGVGLHVDVTAYVFQKFFQWRGHE